MIGFLGICAAAWLALERLWVLGLDRVRRGGPGGLARRAASRATRAAPRSSGPSSTRRLDRLAEGVIFGAIGITFAQDGKEWGLAACFVALTGSFLVSYTRARAEGLGIPASSGGLMGRPERLVIVGAGLFLGASATCCRS